MDECCSGESDVLEALRRRQSRTLGVVLAVNLCMFAVEFVAGLIAGSIALLADSLDMLGDALVYGFSLFVVSRDAIWKAWAAVMKAVVMALFGLFVLGQMIYKVMVPEVPAYETMGVVAAVALAANAFCVALLWQHRSEDINMRSVWLCSRNDLAANVLVMVAAVAVWVTVSPWPDLAAGALICALFLRSAFTVAREAGNELKRGRGRVATRH